VVLLVTVAFIGGLLAMVVIARWQTGKPDVPATQPNSVAQAVPEAVAETAEPMSAVSPTPAEETVPEPEQGADTPEVESRRVQETTTTGTGRTLPPSSKTGDGETTSVGEDHRTGRPEPRRRASAPEAQPPGSAATRDSRRFGEKKTSADALPSDGAYSIGTTQQQSNRSLGRRTASDSTTASSESGEDATPVPDDPQTQDPYDPPDPVDDPHDEPDVEPEPEPPPPALVRAYPVSDVFTVDDVVSVAVEIQSGTDVGHVPFHLAFDPRVLRFEGADQGDFLGVDGAPTAFFAAPASSGDEVWVGLSRLGSGPGIDGAGTLCTLNFVAVGPGTTQLRFKLATVRDSGDGVMPSNFKAGAVNVVANP